MANRLLERLLDQPRPPKICHLVVNVAGKSDPLIQDVSRLRKAELQFIFLISHSQVHENPQEVEGI